MIDDILYKMIRKALPRQVYRGISQSFFGRKKHYHKAPTYLDIHNHYLDHGLRFDEKVVLELGPGDQYFTALSFLSGGAKKVILVDPEISPKTLATDLEEYQRTTGNSLPDNPENRIVTFPDIQRVSSEFDSKVDVMCSHNVLEHFTDLKSFFVHSQRLLSDAGVSYHRVDLSDHTYHVFDKHKLTHAINQRRGLHHLRYSNRAYALLNDPKCFMNRQLLPTYLELAERHKLEVKELLTIPYRKVPIHSDLFSGTPGKERLYITAFSIVLAKAR